MHKARVLGLTVCELKLLHVLRVLTSFLHGDDGYIGAMLVMCSSAPAFETMTVT